MKKLLYITMLALVGLAACKKDDSWLSVPPLTVLSNELTFSDPALVLSVLGDLYNRHYDISGLDNGWQSFTDFSESFPSENGSSFIVQRTGWGYGEWGTWDYGYVRELNLFIERAGASTALVDSVKKRFVAEARYLRAAYYFEMVKRMGGVPLITKSLTVDVKDVAAVQFPRAKESDVYDFVISECEALKVDLPTSENIKSRVTKGAALAMESRAALYAGSIAKYGATTPAVALPGGEVGIPLAKANDYYTKALNASKAIIEGTVGNYQLYKSLPDLSDNFANIFLDKSSANQETIFVEDFRVGSRTHGFTINDQPFSISDEGGDAGRLNPSLNLVENFERLDNTYAPIPSVDGGGNPIYYTNQQDIFAGRDARLAGTVLLPNALFKAKRTDVWAGFLLADGSILTSDEAGQLKPLPGTTTPAVQVVGRDGPVNGLEFRTQTGFYIRKYLDPAIGSGRRGRGSEVAFIRYRLGEIILNAAEAAFELGQPTVAATYLNMVRSRAGLTTPLVGGDVTFDRIVHERRVELAFEGHKLFDMKRWRIAHLVWNGDPTSKTDLLANIGNATQKSTQPWGLWPYRIYNPGNPNHNKWVFREILPNRVTGRNRFLLGNYYSQIGDNILSANPKITRQPNQ